MTCETHDWQTLAYDSKRPKAMYREYCSKCPAVRFVYGTLKPGTYLDRVFNNDLLNIPPPKDSDET